MPCPDDNTLNELVSGVLDGALRASVEEHLDGCSACFALLADLARLMVPEPEPDPDASDEAGALPQPFGGRYRPLRILGVGGMGLVYAARDEALQREVALKVLLDSGEEVERRLAREARALAALSHPHVVEVFDVGSEQGQVFIATELIEGGTLRQWLERRPRPSASEIVEVILGAAEGLAAAHREGIVHRDVSPNNIFVGADGRARIGDFGLAHVIRDEAGSTGAGDSSSTSGSGAVAGTPGYLAPEVLVGAGGTTAADQYSLCATALEALAPCTDDAPTRRVCSVLSRGRSEDPADRYPSVDALLVALRRARRGSLGRWLAGGVVGGLAITGVVFLMLPEPTPCERGAARWDDTEARAEAMLARVTEPAVRARVDERIEQQMGSWSDTFLEVCDDGSMGAEEREARLRCLGEQRRAVVMTVEALADAPTLEVTALWGALEELPPAARCLEPGWEALRDGAPPPELRAAAEELEARLEALEVALRLGPRTVEGEEIDALVGEAEALAFPPLEVRAALLQGRSAREHGRSEDAQRAFTRAAHRATEAGLDEAAAEAWLEVLQVTAVELARPREGESIDKTIDALLRRQGGSPRLEAKRALTLGTIEDAQGHLDQARPHFEDALERLRALHGDRSIAVVGVLDSLAANRAKAGDRERARELFDRVLTQRRELLGPGHAEVGDALANLGILAAMEERWDEAASRLRQALEILEATLPPNNPRTTQVRDGLAVVLRATDPEAALPLLRRSVELHLQREGPEHPAAIDARLQLAQALAMVGRMEQSNEVLDEAARHLDEPSVPPQLRAMILSTRGENAIEQGDGSQVERSCRAAAEALADDPIEPWLGGARTCLALGLAMQGRHPEALATWEQAFDSELVELGGGVLLAERGLRIADRLAADDPEAARTLAARSRTVAEEMGNEALVAEIVAWLEEHEPAGR